MLLFIIHVYTDVQYHEKLVWMLRSERRVNHHMVPLKQTGLKVLLKCLREIKTRWVTEGLK